RRRRRDVATTSTSAPAIPAARALPRPRAANGRWLPYLLAVPILAYEAVFILYPIWQGLVASLYTQSAIGRPPEWAGLGNYRRLLADGDFWKVTGNTIVYMVAVIAIAIGFGLFSATVLNRPFRGRTAARAMMTVPWAFPDVPAVLVFIWMLNPNFGVMNVLANLLPWVHANPTCLFDPALAMLSVILITAWKGFPFYSLVILAALQGVPQELLEAARVDGASRWQSFRAVTLPWISPTLLLLSVLAAIFSFKQFTIIWLLTGGGPSEATETIVVRIYQTAFRFHDFSYASAFGVAGFLIALSIALLFLMIQRRQEMTAR
ncbi:MAG TPA: sugar ABC transporter permease, partial [Thermomicrobiales bacterium]|nr:sugar ABC transporter permease [Thermomicrobiales bacterium]